MIQVYVTNGRYKGYMTYFDIYSYARLWEIPFSASVCHVNLDHQEKYPRKWVVIGSRYLVKNRKPIDMTSAESAGSSCLLRINNHNGS